MARSSRTRRFFSLTAMAFAVPLFLWAVYVGLTAGLQEDAPDVGDRYTTVAVARHDLSREVIGTGSIAPVEEFVVQTEIFGVVARVLVDDGDRVARGDLIAEIDSTAIRQQIQELEAQVALAQANARFEPVAQAEVRQEKAARDFARAQSLHEQGLVADDALEKARYELDLAQLALHDARAQTEARRAEVEIGRARLARARTDLEKTMIRAPIDGVVVRRLVDVGQTVVGLAEGGTRIATLVDDQSMHAIVQVDENDIVGVEVGQPVKVAIDAFAGQTFAGTVRKVAWSGAAEKGVASFAVEVELEPDRRFRVGMSVDVRILVGSLAGVVAIPNAAILRDGGRTWVSRVSGSEVARAEVTLGFSDGFYTEVTDGVAEGDTIRVLADRLN